MNDNSNFIIELRFGKGITLFVFFFLLDLFH